MKGLDLNLGIIEFFSILLPGAILLSAFLISFDPAADLARQLPILREELYASAAFLLAAYGLGHFILPIASAIDETIYAWDRGRSERCGDCPTPATGRCRFRRSILSRLIRRRPRAAPVSAACMKARADRLKRQRPALFRANELRFQTLSKGRPGLDQAQAGCGGMDPTNTYKWARAILIQQAPAAAHEVQRFEADSKFFRSLVVVMSIAAGLAAYQQAWVAAAGSALLTIFAYHSYRSRRIKSTQAAYEHVLVYFNLRAFEAPLPANDRPANDSQAVIDAR